jgi:hypothetical protein
LLPNLRSNLPRIEAENWWNMQHIVDGYRGVALLINLNWDRIIYVSTMIVALYAGAFVGSFF